MELYGFGLTIDTTRCQRTIVGVANAYSKAPETEHGRLGIHRDRNSVDLITLAHTRR